MPSKSRPKPTGATPAILAAERANIPFTTLAYTHNPAAPAYGPEAAAALGLDPATVYKTLIAAIDTTRLVVAIIPVTARLNLKALATAAGGKRADLADPAAAERATGYVLGGISPLGARRPLPTLLDATALTHPTIHVSAGRRGLELALAPSDLIALTAAIVTTLT